MINYTLEVQRGDDIFRVDVGQDLALATAKYEAAAELYEMAPHDRPMRVTLYWDDDNFYRSVHSAIILPDHFPAVGDVIIFGDGSYMNIEVVDEQVTTWFITAWNERHTKFFDFYLNDVTLYAGLPHQWYIR